MVIAINYWAVLVAAIVAYAAGALWYSPALFGKVWMRLTKLTPEQMNEAKKKGMATSYIVGFISTFVMAWIFAAWLGTTGNADVKLGLTSAFWIWLGFIATSFLMPVLWEKQPLKLYFINIGHYLVALLIIGAILGGWQ
jgi:hypothetical protein